MKKVSDYIRVISCGMTGQEKETRKNTRCICEEERLGTKGQSTVLHMTDALHLTAKLTTDLLLLGTLKSMTNS